MAAAGGMDAINMNTTDASIGPSSNDPGMAAVAPTGLNGRPITMSANDNLSRRSSVESTTTNKKRTKVSRACDQCRRKKLKCEYQGGSQSCIGCLKNKDKCAFDRVPLKRGPSKGYSRTRSMSQERNSSRKRSTGEEGNSTVAGTTCLDQHEAFAGKNSPSVPLPPLHYYLPGSNNQKGQSNGSTLAQQGSSNSAVQQYPSIQQQFWKVPYYEHQFQRRPSLESLNSDISVRQSQHEPGIPSTASSVSRGQSRPVQGHASNRDPLADLLNERPQSSSILPPLVRSSSVPHVAHQLPLPQYPYSQFSAAAANGSSLRTGQPPPQLIGDHLDKASLPYSQNPQGSVFRRTNSVPEGAFPSSLTARQSSVLSYFPTGVVTSERDLKKDLVEARINNGCKTIERNHDYNCETDLNMSSPSSNFEPWVLSDMELIEQYYEHIHLNYPVLPVNKETLTNEVLLVNTQPVSEVHKLNGYILTWFRTSLELLIRISSGRSGARETSSSMNGNSESGSNGGSYRRSADLSNIDSKAADDPLFTQSAFVTTLNECFQKVVDIHPSVRENKDFISPKVTTIYLTTFIILNYILALVGYDNSFILGMSVTIFNEFKLFRPFLLRDVSLPPEFERSKEAASDNSVREKKDEDQEAEVFEMLYNRLYYSLIVFDSLQSCCFGVPKLISIPIDHMISPLFQPRGPLKDDKWAIETDPQRLQILMTNLNLGALLAEICQTKKITHAFFPITSSTYSMQQLEAAPENHQFQNIRRFRIPKLDDDSTLAGLFFQFLWIERELLDQLLAASDFRTSRTSAKTQKGITINSADYSGNGCLSRSFCVMVSNSICTLTSKAHHLLQLMATLNPTNCIRPHSSLGESDNSDILAKGSVSPFAVAIFCHLFSVIEIAKSIPNSLIGYVMSVQAQDTHGQELVVALSKCMSDMIKIQRFSHSLKPFKIFRHGLHEDKKGEASYLEQLKRAHHYQVDQDNPKGIALQQFIDIAWDLLEEELGWL